MAERKAFLLRIDPALWEALEKWAADELRSVNGQIEYLLARAVDSEGRGRRPATKRTPKREG
ncbi:MAG TPA: hypothetical protein VE326_06785 [Candidatus Binatia bacterium]|nr:hypothetical protein [Candidatus Binatia bacterium]